MAILLSILLKLVLLRDPLLVLPLYTSMIFQMMFSVLLITMLVKLLSTPSMIRLWFVVKIRVGFWTWMWPKKHLWTGTGNGLLTSKLGNSTSFNQPFKQLWCYWYENEWICSWWKKCLYRCWDWLSSKLDWHYDTVYCNCLPENCFEVWCF